MTLSKKDWTVWLRGLIGAGISGASAAISTGIGSIMIAPDRFNLNAEIGNLFKLIITTATVSFFVSITKYLKEKPIPEDLPE